MSETAANTPKIPDFLTSEGELGEMIRHFDWAATSLGPISSWSQSLKTTVNLMLHSRNPIWIGWGPENTFLYNDAYIDVLGIDKHGWALGKPASVVWEEIWDVCGPLSDKVYARSEASSSNDVQFFMKRGDFLEEVFYSFSYSPIYDEFGKVSGLFCPNFETTAKILSARRNKTLSELAAKSLIEKNIQSAYASAAEILGKNPEDIPFAVFYNVDKSGQLSEIVERVRIESSSGDFFPDSFTIDEDGGAYSEVAEILKTGKPKIIRVTNPGIFQKGQAGQPVKMLIALPLTTTAQRTGGILICGVNPTRRLDQDYTTFFDLVAGQVSAALQNATAIENERKRLEELAEIDKAKTAFFSNISHEFRTPLTLMLGPIEELLESPNLKIAYKQSIETTHRNALRLLKLVNTLLDFSLIESGRSKAAFVPTDISALTKSLAGNFRSITEKAGLKLVLDTNKLSQKVYADKEMWEKIIFNLLSNAYKYTLRGSITVKVTEEGSNAVLRVIDTGTGIPQKELPNMFSRFHRIRGAEGRSFEGSGIGLSMIKELIAQHGGTITVDSEEGQGSTFTVSIPFGKQHLPDNQVFEAADGTEDTDSGFIKEARRLALETANEAIEVTHQAVDSTQRVILIVDDNADMRLHLKSVIEKEYNVLTANNGAEALEIISGSSPALILSDIMMPVMDGIELLREVKSNPAISMIPVILLTARAGEESRIEGYETGADDYLVKPFSAKELIARIRSQIKVSDVRDHSRKQLKNLFMQAPAAICILRGRNFVVEMANEGILALWSKTPEQMMGKPLLEGLPEAADQGYDKLLENVYDTGIPHVDEEAPFYKINGDVTEQTYVKFVYQPMSEDDGSVTAIMVLAIEITPQVLARKKIEESEAKFSNLIRHAPMGIVIVKGEELVFDMANDVYLGIHSKTREEMIERRLVDVIPQFKGTALEANLKHVLATGESLSFANRPIAIQEDGVWVTRYFNSIYQPLIENNRITGVISVVNEVTEQYLAQKIKDRNEQDLKLILETMPHIAFRANPEGYVTYFNKRYFDYTGLTFEEAAGHGWTPVIHPDMLEEVFREWMHAVSNGLEYKASFLIKRASDQSYRWNMSRTVPLRNDKGEITEWIGTLTDIHESKVFSEQLEAMVNERTGELHASYRLLEEKNAELEKTNKELESFNYVASHDLQEPLRKIQTFISMIQDRGKDGEIAENYLNKIYSSAGRMSQLIQDVLTYSRVAAEDQFAPVDLNEILDNVLADYELLITEKNAAVHRHQLPKLRAVGLQMHQLLSNLVSNALKYCDVRPEISITCKEVSVEDIAGKARKMAEIVFTDNGIGFEPQYSEQIFKLFRRLHGRTEYSGTGIGLSICKKIVEQHQGSIVADSAPGKGTTFTIRLPL